MESSRKLAVWLTFTCRKSENRRIHFVLLFRT